MPVTGSGALRVVYVVLTACLAPTVTSCGCVKASVGVECLSAWSWRATEAVVGAGPRSTTMWTMLFLSLNVTSTPDPLCVHPSGYLIE